MMRRGRRQLQIRGSDPAVGEHSPQKVFATEQGAGSQVQSEETGVRSASQRPQRTLQFHASETRGYEAEPGPRLRGLSDL